MHCLFHFLYFALTKTEKAIWICETRDVTIWVNGILPVSVLQYIGILQYVVRLIKEHIMSLKLAKKLSRNIKLYCIFLVTRGSVIFAV